MKKTAEISKLSPLSLLPVSCLSSQTTVLLKYRCKIIVKQLHSKLCSMFYVWHRPANNYCCKLLRYRCCQLTHAEEKNPKLLSCKVFSKHLMCYCCKTKPARKAVKLENVLTYSVSRYSVCQYSNAAVSSLF